MNTSPAWDTYRVLPHRQILDCCMYAADGSVIGKETYEHVPCGMELHRVAILDNWCPHCAAALNKAAAKRAAQARAAA